MCLSVDSCRKKWWKKIKKSNKVYDESQPKQWNEFSGGWREITGFFDTELGFGDDQKSTSKPWSTLKFPWQKTNKVAPSEAAAKANTEQASKQAWSNFGDDWQKLSDEMFTGLGTSDGGNKKSKFPFKFPWKRPSNKVSDVTVLGGNTGDPGYEQLSNSDISDLSSTDSNITTEQNVAGSDTVPILALRQNTNISFLADVAALERQATFASGLERQYTRVSLGGIEDFQFDLSVRPNGTPAADWANFDSDLLVRPPTASRQGRPSTAGQHGRPATASKRGRPATAGKPRRPSSIDKFKRPTTSYNTNTIEPIDESETIPSVVDTRPRVVRFED